jgi:hypothetical protein
VGDDVPVDSVALLVTDFINFKIKPAQSFRGALRDRMYIHIFIEVSALRYFNFWIAKVGGLWFLYWAFMVNSSALSSPILWVDPVDIYIYI